MKYINANIVLPTELIQEVQKYVKGSYIYIPVTKEHKAWGEVSGYRNKLERRNAAIIEKFQKGVSMEQLAEQYYLSIYTIRKIIYQR